MHTIVATYRNIGEAQKVLTDLVNAGFDRDDISLVASDAEGRYQNLANRTDVTDVDDVSAGEGALVGGLEGGLIGFALGLGALAIPGIGPVLAFGPLIGGLIGAGTGAVTGGLVAGLIDMGVDETDAHVYSEAVRRGYVLLSVRAPEGRENEARAILDRYSPVDIDDRANDWRSQGWTGYDVNAKPLTTRDLEAERSYSSSGTATSMGSSATGQSMSSQRPLQSNTVRSYASSTPSTMSSSGTGSSSFSSNLEDFRKHYQTNYANNQYSFSNYEPAYQYGSYLASEPRYRNRTWTEIEPDIRRDWESRSQGAWEDFKDSIRYAWERTKAAVR
jgi:uncharacterized membrane protein